MSANSQTIKCITLTHSSTPSYLHPSLFGREEDALAWFPQAASPLRGGKHFRFMVSNINICAVTCLQVDDSCHRLCNASLVNKRDT